MEEWCAKWKVVREGERYYRQFRTRFWDRPGNHHSRCWTPRLEMLPAFLDEPDLEMLPAFLDKPDLGILLDSGRREGGIFFEY
ncbi:hypothetical protein RclHR1_02650026 [Rhizophagus clarus]|uniref:Uncharacterized protein n=1 Tax=Rhizophagus clarus TaxID=94130 RepID=A0A2Z6R1Y3_9GLOM|nr:hypothetical protein RclHR1_02650026 [Rhizophagus clarus]